MGARIFGGDFGVGELAGYLGDDVLAERSVTWSAAELAAALPSVGSMFEEEIGYKGKDDNYTVTYRGTRMS